MVGNEYAAFTMRWFHRYELEHLMVRAGFAKARAADGEPSDPRAAAV